MNSRLLETLELLSEVDPARVLLIGRDAIHEDQDYTAKQLWEAIEVLAGAFNAAGIRHLGLAGDNSPQWLVIQLAAWRAGIVVTPVANFFSAEQCRHLLATTALDAIASAEPGALTRLASLEASTESLADESWHAQLDHEIGEGEWRSRCLSLEKGEAVYLIQRSSIPAAVPAGTALITFTSGTTGAPKGVCLSLEHLEKVLRGLSARLEPVTLKRHGVLLPLAVLLENLAGGLLALWQGRCAIVDTAGCTGLIGSGGLNALTLESWLDERRPQSLILVPNLLQALVALCESSPIESPWRNSLRLVAVGGAKVPALLLARAMRLGLPVAQGYGLSELGSVVCLSLPGEEKGEIDSVGQPLEGLNLSLDDTGQLMIHGRRMLGYLGELNPLSADQPWPSGDLARCLETGGWCLEGRQRDVLILSSGRNVSPGWIEAELALIPGIRQAFVEGDGLCGLIALLAPVLNGDSTCTEGAIARAITLLNSRLPDYARLVAWQVLKASPDTSQPLSIASGEMTDNGRLRRARIRELRGDDLKRLAQRLSTPSTVYPCLSSSQESDVLSRHHSAS
ncbi:AMP-binding protein [Cobetia marina]|uniref:AMP-binding protein n=1 Tax=Cobetia marina TaxID=28258 RepID=UPI0011412484|nr:AMP-binding protein [Cobetia marina]GED43365.1 long-chain acyl-CoA synthetase [Cobetia marina]